MTWDRQAFDTTLIRARQREEQITTEQRLDRVEEWIARLSELVLEDREVLDEVRRENRQTRRIWIAIARKQQLFDEDEFNDVFGDDEELDYKQAYIPDYRPQQKHPRSAKTGLNWS